MRAEVPRDIILFSTADWDSPFWTNKQHIAARLANKGFRVLYIESAGLRRPAATRKDFTRIFRRLGKSLRGIRQVRDNLWIYSPLVIPLHNNAAVRFLNREILIKAIRLYSRRLKFNTPLFWTYNPFSVELLDRLRISMVVYHCVDDLSAAPGMPSTAIKEAEEKLVRAADLVFTTSPNLQVSCARLNPDDTHFLPNVGDFDHFSKARREGPVPDDLAEIPRPRIGFIGAISDYKVDFELIEQIAKRRSQWQWVLIGEVGEGQPETSIENLKLPNIHFLGPKPYENLPDYLRGFDVAALPSRLNDYTVSMFPIKFFEYLSAGIPVVATDLPALKEFDGAYVAAGNTEEFLIAVENILAGETPSDSLCLELAKKHTWDWRLEQMLELLSRKQELLLRKK